jgi:hypothetical protein
MQFGLHEIIIDGIPHMSHEYLGPTEASTRSSDLADFLVNYCMKC